MDILITVFPYEIFTQGSPCCMCSQHTAINQCYTVLTHYLYMIHYCIEMLTYTGHLNVIIANAQHELGYECQLSNKIIIIIIKAESIPAFTLDTTSNLPVFTQAI